MTGRRAQKQYYSPSQQKQIVYTTITLERSADSMGLGLGLGLELEFYSTAGGEDVYCF